MHLCVLRCNCLSVLLQLYLDWNLLQCPPECRNAVEGCALCAVNGQRATLLNTFAIPSHKYCHTAFLFVNNQTPNIKYSLFVKINKYSSDCLVSALPQRHLDLALGDSKPCDSAQPQFSKRKQSPNGQKDIGNSSSSSSWYYYYYCYLRGKGANFTSLENKLCNSCKD